MERINKVFRNGEPLSAEELNGIVRYINELGETIEENLEDWSSQNAVEEMWNSLREDNDSNRIHNSHSPLSYPLSSINGANLGLPPYSDMAITSDGNGGWLWKKVNQGGGGGGSSSLLGINKLRTYFLNVTHGIVPSAPSVNNYNSSPQDNFTNGQDVWTFTNTNPTNNLDTYAIWVWFQGNTPVNIDGPIKIFDGAINSSNGEDGEEIEWIYRRVNTIPTEATLNTWESTLSNCKGDVAAKDNKTFRNVDAVPLDWNDNPSGVTFDEKYEYASFRRSSLNSNGKRIWGETGFCRPFIWSTYGEQGMDGDGIEYIFWGKAEAVNDWNAFSLNSQNLVNYPPSWTNNEGFQNNEYFGPNGSSWTDDALGINNTTRKYIYMSKRKKTTNPLTGISSWDAFSIPVLWNLYNETSFTSNIFKRSSTKPNKPGANEGSFLYPVPSGWSDGIPAGTDSIWITSRIFSSNGQYPLQDEWNDVQLMSDTESFDVEFSPIESNPGTPTTNPNNWYDPTTDTDADWTNMIWMATRIKSNGVWGSWNITKIKGEKGDKGDPGSGSSYDDTEIRNAISTLNNTVANEKNRLDGVINNLNSSIQTEVESLLDDATWVQNNFPEGSGSSSNFGQQDVENYLQTIGVWSNDEVHNKTNAAWSKISQSVSEITSRVATLETNGIDTESLSSTINQKIAKGEIELNLDNTYAKKTTVDGIEQVLEWMYSGLKTSTNPDKTIAELVTAGKNALTSAIADIRTQVNKLENGDYLATASVDAKVKDSISGMLATADSTTAAGLFFSNVGNALNAGFITEANLSTKAASAGLMASNGFTAAAILALVNEDTSAVAIKADKITLDGQTVANSISAANITLSGRVEANNFQAGPSNQLNIKTTGNRISFCDGSTEKAWFVLDGSGLQLHIIDNTGTERIIDWNYWDSATPTYRPLQYYYKNSENNPSSAFSLAQLYVKQGTYYQYNSSTGNYDTISSGTFYTKDVLSVLPEIAETDFNAPVLYRVANSSSNIYEPRNAQTPTQAGLPGYNGKMLYDAGLAVDPSYIDVYTEYTITSSSITATGYKVSIARQLPSAISTSSSNINMSSSNISFIVPGPNALTQQSIPSIGHARTVRTPINTVSSVSSARTTSSFVAEEGDNNGTYIDIDGNSQTRS